MMDDQQTAPAMVMTVLEARVAEAYWPRLRQAFEDAAAQLPAQIVQSFLVQGADDPALWRVVTVWRSREALTEYRRSVEVAGGVLMFRAVEAEPTLAIFDVAVHAGLSSSE